MGLVPKEVKSRRDIVIELDPLGIRSGNLSPGSFDVHFLSVFDGPDAAVCEILGYLGSRLFAEVEASEAPQRIVIGDVASVASLADSARWAACIAVVASIVSESGWGIPVIAYDSSAVAATAAGGLALLRWRADLVIEVKYGRAHPVGHVTSRADGTFELIPFSS